MGYLTRTQQKIWNGGFKEIEAKLSAHGLRIVASDDLDDLLEMNTGLFQENSDLKGQIAQLEVRMRQQNLGLRIPERV